MTDHPDHPALLFLVLLAAALTAVWTSALIAMLIVLAFVTK